MKVLITGSSGFVGSRVVELAKNKNWHTVSVTRQYSHAVDDGVFVPSIDATTDWSGAFDGIDCIVHCAALVHQMNDSEDEIRERYREVNTLGTINLAKQAFSAGVKRFVFISSIKVNGELTLPNIPFTHQVDEPPCDPYGLSKYEAEAALRMFAEESGLEVVIIRPPLVYGVGVKANFLTMMKWVYRRIPLPLGAIHNQRSFVYVDNLVDLILTCCIHPKATGETFLVSDGHDVSTSQLLKALAKAMEKSSYLLPIPMTWFQFASKVIGKPEIAQRLCGSLQVDIRKTRNVLGWKPPVCFEEAMQKTVKGMFNSEKD